MRALLTLAAAAALASAPSVVLAQSGKCFQTHMIQPQPFLGTADEIIVLADGSVWKDLSYKYLYLYAYSPRVIICPDAGLMIVRDGSSNHEFTVMRIK